MTNSKETSTAEVEARVFVPNETKIHTVHGEYVIVPKITWKKEIQLIRLIESVLEGFAGASGEDIEDQSMVALVQRMLSVAPEKATKFVSVVLEKDDDWVEDNLDLPEIVSLILPLLKQRLDTIGTKIAPYVGTESASALVVAQSLEAVAKTKLN